MSSEERLLFCSDVSDDYGGAEGIEQVFVVGVEDQTVFYGAWVRRENTPE